MPTAFLPSAKDKAILQGLIDEKKRQIEAMPPKVSRLGWLDGTDHHPPETYVAYPQSAGGIPALSPGTGAGGADEPGSDTCDIYLIDADGDLVEPSASFSKTVYNLTADALDQDWMAVTRTKYGKWIAVVSVSNPLILYEITAAGTYDGSIKEFFYGGKSVVYDTDNDLYEVQSGETQKTLWHPPAFREDLTGDGPSDDAANTQRSFHVGQRVYITIIAGRKEIVSPPLDRWRFELKDVLLVGTTATAQIRRWTGADWATNAAIEFEVTDRDGVFLGYGSDLFSTGAYGVARYWPDSNKWEIEECQGLAEEIEVTLNEDMGETDADAASCDIDDYYRGQNPDPLVSGNLQVEDPQGHFTAALSGAKAKATLNKEDAKYILRVCELPAVNITLYEIAGVGTYDATSKEWKYNALLVEYNDGNGLWEVEAGTGYATLWHPTAIREDLTDDGPSDEAAETQVNFYVGQRVYVELRGNRLEIISPPLDEWRFELKDNLDPGDTSATAYYREYTGGDWTTDTNIEIEVYDARQSTDSGGIYYGRGNASWSDEGSMGVAKYWPDSNKWEIVSLTPHTLKIKGELTAALATGDATKNIDEIVLMQPTGSVMCPDQLDGGGDYVGVKGATYVTCQNSAWFGMEGDDGNVAVAEWNATDERWYFIQVECPA